MANKKIMNVDIKTKAFMKVISSISKDALPEAAALTLNFTADQVTKQQIANVKRDMIVRTPFTIRSMSSGRAKPFKALFKARGKSMKRMFSIAGTFSPYLWMHEEGRNIEGKNGPIPIATDFARVRKSKKRSIAKRNRLSENQSLKNGSSFTSGNGAQMRVLKPRGSNKGRPRRFGVYTVVRGKMKMVRNLETNRAKVKGRHFHSDAVKRKGNNQLIASRFRKYGKKAIKKAVRLHG